jgi:hypothetical protein
VEEGDVFVLETREKTATTALECENADIFAWPLTKIVSIIGTRVMYKYDI